MAKLFMRTLTWLLLGLVGSAVYANSPVQQPSVAFYYGNEPPVELLSQFDWIVVEAANVDSTEQRLLAQHGGQPFAYVSIGELDAWRGASTSLPADALVTSNTAWNSQVADLTHSAWRTFLIEEHIRPLWESGYRGLFLDTLDSYRLFAPDGPAAERRQAALVDIIHSIKQQFPDMQLLLNRGFEVLNQVQGQIVGVAAESLYRGWNPATQVYGAVPDNDRAWLYTQLARVREHADKCAQSTDDEEETD